ncbi:MAG: hypothetical protein Q7U82_09250 [Gammaproteobacteria bacterium]|nr:hypothetical protein [Gammaproteobacteria bacterium]
MRQCDDEWEQVSLTEIQKMPIFTGYFQMKNLLRGDSFDSEGQINFQSAFIFPTFIPTFIPTFTTFIPARAVKLAGSCYRYSTKT